MNFAQVQPAVDPCKMRIMSVVEDSLAWKRLQEYWPLKYRAELGELTGEHKDRANCWHQILYRDLQGDGLKFPRVRCSYQLQNIRPCLRSSRQTTDPLLELGVAHQINAECVLLRENLVSELSDCRTAADICHRMIRSQAYSCFLNLCTFARSPSPFPCRQPGQNADFLRQSELRPLLGTDY